MSIRSLFASDISTESLMNAILKSDRNSVREEKKLRCTVCGNVHVSIGGQSLCPVCKRLISKYCSVVY